MGKSKVKANKKAPPKSLPALTAVPATTAPSLYPLPPNRPLSPLDLDHAQPHPASGSSLLPPSTAVDLNDPTFRTAWQNWTTSALGRLDQLPKLSQTQLNAIAGAAAGMDGSANLGIDLPASLAALFEAKLTLDREKAKLVRMQKELKGYKDAAGSGSAQAMIAAAAAAASAQAHAHAHTNSHNHGHVHGHVYEHGGYGQGAVVDGNGKGKEVMLEEDYGECTCHEHEDYYESDEDGYECDCDCHGCEHDDEEEEEPRSTLADDPERFDEAVRELFNWIKAVVWTIEQAAIVAGKRR